MSVGTGCRGVRGGSTASYKIIKDRLGRPFGSLEPILFWLSGKIRLHYSILLIPLRSRG